MQLPRHDREGLVALGWSLLDETVAELNQADAETRAAWTLRVERCVAIVDTLLGRAEAVGSVAADPSGTDAFDDLVRDLDD